MDLQNNDLDADLSWVAGKTFLITGGTLREAIDGVRHFSNHTRPEDHGFDLAQKLAQMGAKIVFVTSQKNLEKSYPGITVITTTPSDTRIISAQDMVTTCNHILSQKHFDGLLNLASQTSIRPAHPTNHKLKVKTASGADVTIEIMGNLDVLRELRRNTNLLLTVGYNHMQELDCEDDKLRDLIENCRLHQEKTILEPSGFAMGKGKLRGKKIIVTSGPTVEQITTTGDIITNFSSGKQGHSIAAALAKQGAEVILVTGPTKLPNPSGVRAISITSARELQKACLGELPADAAICVAAVADFGIETPLNLALNENEVFTLTLQQNPDTLRKLGTHETQRPTVVIGFAAETQNVVGYARGKLESKGTDAICANEVGDAIVQRGSGNNQIVYITSNGEENWGLMSKDEVGEALAEKILMLLRKKKDLSPKSSFLRSSPRILS